MARQTPDLNPQELQRLLNRRTFLNRGTAYGVGAAALAAMVGAGRSTARAADVPNPLASPVQFVPKAKRVIQLYMAGGPSHLETLDPKPKLAAMHGQAMPESFTQGKPIAQLQGAKLVCYAPQHKFLKFGQSGLEFSEVLPKIGAMADDICIVRSMFTDAINHDPAHTFMNTGTTISGRPAMGSWVLYGLGSEADNLPGYVVLTSTGKYGQAQPIAARQWHSGFLPSRFQGVEFRSKGDAVLYAGNPAGVDRARQHDVISTIETLNRAGEGVLNDPEIQTRIGAYETAFQMQMSVPDLLDLSDEPEHVFQLYGTRGGDGSFAANCLLARRLAERGVRFIQLYHRDWDHHGAIKEHVAGTAQEVDQASAALLIDLKQRGLLEDTIVTWGGEFGRTPMAQGDGRDHHIKGFSMWMAGGGIKGGISHGATDELGYESIEDVVSVHDLHATILRQLGLDHLRLTYKYQGRDFRLTDVAGIVVEKILA